MEELLKNIQIQLNRIEQKVDSIEEQLSKIDKETSKMNDHIHFVETTYNRVRVPLSYIKNKIEFMMGSSNNNDLPLIEQSENKNIEDN